jgi:Flp pilus assembly protein TadG
VLPILLLVLLALVQVGVLARDQLVLTQASRAGAREAAVDGSVEAVQEAVRSAASALDAERISVDVAWSGSRGDPVTVSIAYEVAVASSLAGWMLPRTVTLRSSATMRQEFA